MRIDVQGAAEVQRAFRHVEKSLATKFGNDLKKAVEPVVKDAQRFEGRWRGASIRTIRARRRGPNVYVEQSARKVTGMKGQFGTLQLRDALEPALEENADKVFESLEDVLNHYAGQAGF